MKPTLNENLPSASGARITGDDVQYAVAWHAGLRTLVPHAGVSGVTVEAINAGNVDDVVIAKTRGPNEYNQVKAAVSAERPATLDWLCEPTRSGRSSILQRFHQARTELSRNEERPQLTLVTTRSIDPADPVLTLRDRNDRLSERLRYATSTPALAGRDRLIAHLGCTGDELFDFLADLRLRTDASEAVWRDHIAEISYAAGVRADDTAYRLGIAEVREWVKTNRVERRAEDIGAAVDRLGLHAADPFTILAINSLDEYVAHPDAAISLNWVDRFRGSEARNRRGLHNPQEWETVLRPQLVDAQRALRGIRSRRVLVTGTMRLPTWFTAGVVFQETAGFTIAKIKDGELWVRPTHPVDPAPISLSRPPGELLAGQDVALAIAIATDLTADVQRYLASTGRDIPLVTVRPASGTSNASISGLNHAYGLALAIRDLAREIARTVRPPVLHLFLATPAGFAVLLGGVWDRVPTTQTYEDLAAEGYEPAFYIPN
ncbi:SAVED domain-containing protein [Actinomadura rayongensis]|uniref:SAVED domain-containing protein n=1 Tax=Actinomadura rayongensis TaxID=1429076 RepID=A0A6I4WG69_9ACTN|nr:SAVED domain-containing protein [Actinomadura rayongensis]MXQ65582.1 SAVED domain-containing protein [Actinomadura rayongensis]